MDIIRRTIIMLRFSDRCLSLLVLHRLEIKATLISRRD